MKTISKVNKRIPLTEIIGKVHKILEFAEKEAADLILSSQHEKEILDKAAYQDGFNRGVAAGIASVQKIHNSKKILFNQLSDYIVEICEKICLKVLDLDPQSQIFKESIKNRMQLLISEIPSNYPEDICDNFKLSVPQNLHALISEMLSEKIFITVTPTLESKDEGVFILETAAGSFEINQVEHLAQIFSHLKDSMSQETQLTNLVERHCDNVFKLELTNV